MKGLTELHVMHLSLGAGLVPTTCKACILRICIQGMTTDSKQRVEQRG